MLRFTRGSQTEFAGTLHRHLYRQAQILAGYGEGTQPAYVGLSWR